MKRYVRFTLCVFLLLIFTASAQATKATIHGKGYDGKGDDATLSQIDDIVRFVTGSTVGEFTFKKDSLMLINGWKDDSNMMKTHPRIFQFEPENGTGSAVIDDTARYVTPTSFNTDDHTTMPGATLSTRRGAVWHSIQQQEPSKIRLFAWNSEDGQLWGANYIDISAFGNSRIASDIKAGMTVPGYDGEVIAFCTKEGDRAHLNFLTVRADDSNIYFNPIPQAWSIAVAYNGTVAQMYDGKKYFPVSMAVGDYDGDGYVNEIVLVRSDTKRVYYNVLQLTYNNGNFALTHISFGRVFSYDSETSNLDGIARTLSCSVVTGDFDGDGKDEFTAVVLDNSSMGGGFPTNPRANFDSGIYDKTHFSFSEWTGKIHIFVHKWNGGPRFDVTTRPGDSLYKCELTDDKTDTYTPAGDRYRYVTERTYDVSIPVGVKAAVGDFNGDGRDDIAVLRVMINYQEHIAVNTFPYENDTPSRVSKFWLDIKNLNYGAAVDLYTFDTGSTLPHYFPRAGHIYTSFTDFPTYKNDRDVTHDTPDPGSWMVYMNWNDGLAHSWTNVVLTTFTCASSAKRVVHWCADTVPYLSRIQKFFLNPITGENTYYPAIDREWDIIAGKFSGTVGNVVPMDELVIKYPVYAGGSGNHLRTHFGLLSWFSDVGEKPENANVFRFHDIAQIDDRITYTALIKADFLNENLQLGEPVKTTYKSDVNYIGLLQMVPYHVDNLTVDGKQLQARPQNFTFRQGTLVGHKNTSTSESTNNVEYSMTKKQETIFAIDNDALKTGAKGFQAVRGIATTLFGENSAVTKLDAIGKVWDAFSDKVETTKASSDKSSVVSKVTITTEANYLDSLLMSAGTHYIWRYPLYATPYGVETTLTDVSISFDESQVMEAQQYVTLAMSEPGDPTPTLSVNDSFYQPYHEEGNLFSYPGSLGLVEGYDPDTIKPLYVSQGWNGASYNQKLDFANTSTHQDSTQTVNKPGAITKALSFIDNIFGSDLANVPADSFSSFTRSVSDHESLSVNIPTGYSQNAGFSIEFQPYLDVAWTTTVAFAVTDFSNSGELWNSTPDAHVGRAGSLYQRLPDPSFLLPQRFNTSDGQNFTVDQYDSSALKLRGYRFIVADYNQYSDPLLVQGLKYKIRIPVYNASFVSTPADKPLTVRMSIAKTNDWNPKREKLADYTFPSVLPGCKKGQHRQWAEFEWTPDTEGVFYLFFEIDPDHVIDEIHEDRRNASGDLVDPGGNNRGFVLIGVADSENPPFDRNQIEQKYKATEAARFESGEGLFAVAMEFDASVFPHVEWVKVNGMDFKDFIEQEVDGRSQPVPAELEVKYAGDKIVTEAAIVGYALKPEAKGKPSSEVTFADFGTCFVKQHFFMMPGEDHKLHFRINPKHLENGVGFCMNVYGMDYPLTDIVYGSAGSMPIHSSSSSGCEAGFGIMAGLGVLCVMMMKKK